MSLRDEIKPWTDSEGFVANGLTTLGQINASGQAVGFTSLKFITLKKIGEDQSTDLAEFNNFTNSIRANHHKDWKQPPTAGPIYAFTRGPSSSDRNTSIDDYCAWLAACSYYAPSEAAAWLQYGIRHGGQYDAAPDIEKPFFKQFLFRFPQLIAHAVFASKKEPWAILRWFWKFTVKNQMKIEPFKPDGSLNEQDTFMLTWLLIDTALTSGTQDSSIINLCYDWMKSVELRYGPQISIQSVAKNWLAPGHPLGKYFQF